LTLPILLSIGYRTSRFLPSYLSTVFDDLRFVHLHSSTFKNLLIFGSLVPELPIPDLTQLWVQYMFLLLHEHSILQILVCTS
jgi:hypothetical protein